MATKSSKRIKQPLPPLRGANAADILHHSNIRWRHKDFCLLRNWRRGLCERDVYAYVRIADYLYAVPRDVFYGIDNPNIRISLYAAPVLLDLRDVVGSSIVVADRIEVTPALQQVLVSRVTAAWQTVVNSWVSALKKAPQEWNLESLLRQMKPLSFGERFVSNGVDEEVCRQLGYLTCFSYERGLVRSLMLRDELSLCKWDGPASVERHVYQLGSVYERRWARTNSPNSTLRLDAGPLAVVTAESTDARKACERLIEDKTYGDLVLLVGKGEELQHEAKLMSDRLLGVDIVEM